MLKWHDPIQLQAGLRKNIPELFLGALFSAYQKHRKIPEFERTGFIVFLNDRFHNQYFSSRVHYFADCDISLENFYNDQGEYGKSIVYYFDAKNIIESLQQDYQLMAILVNLGDSYEKLNNLDSARLFTEQAYQLTVRLKKQKKKKAYA